MSPTDPGDNFVQREDTSVYETDEPVLYQAVDGIATLTMNRPDFNNAQNSQMTYALDAGFRRAVDDDSEGRVRVAATWTPDPSVAEDFHAYADEHPRASLAVTWAALDCVGGWSEDLEGRPCVLGGSGSGSYK